MTHIITFLCALVHSFYEFWVHFESWRDFSLKAEKETEHDLEAADSRDEKRWMKQEIDRKVKKMKREEMARINLLVERAMAADPRLRKEKERERLEKERQAEAKRKSEMEKAEVERLEKEKQEADDAKKKAEEDAKKKDEKVSFHLFSSAPSLNRAYQTNGSLLCTTSPSRN